MEMALNKVTAGIQIPENLNTELLLDRISNGPTFQKPDFFVRFLNGVQSSIAAVCHQKSTKLGHNKGSGIILFR